MPEIQIDTHQTKIFIDQMIQEQLTAFHSHTWEQEGEPFPNIRGQVSGDLRSSPKHFITFSCHGT